MRVAAGDEFAAVQDHEPIDSGEQSVHDVLDPDDRDTARAYVLDKGNQSCAFVFGETAGDLIEQHYAGTCCESARQFQAFSIEQSKPARPPVRLFCQAAPFEEFGAAIVDRGFSLAGTAALLLDKGNQRCAFVLGEAAGDLVEQQHAWTRCEGAGQFQTLSIEQSQPARTPVRFFC